MFRFESHQAVIKPQDTASLFAAVFSQRCVAETGREGSLPSPEALRFWRAASSLALAAGVFGAGPACAAAQEATDASVPRTRMTVAQSSNTNTPASFETVASTEPDANPEQLLALFPDGTGQGVTSMDDIGLVLGHRQIFSDLRSLQDRIKNDQRPTTNVVVPRSSQSDDLDIRQAELSQDLFFSQGLGQLRLGLQKMDYDPQDAEGVSQYAAGLTGSRRINDFAAFTGEFWINELRSNGASNTKGTYNAFVTLRPSDTVRIDVNTGRAIFDNIRSLQMGLSVTSYGASIDVSPMQDLRLTLRGAYGDYSDGNTRRTEEAEGVWRINSEPTIEVGVRATHFNFSRLLDNGYFNPEDYYSGEGMVRLRSSLSKKLTLETVASAGIEDSDPGGTKPLFKGSLQMAYRLSDRWSLDAELSRFSSRQSSSSGFSRTTALLGLHYRL